MFSPPKSTHRIPPTMHFRALPAPLETATAPMPSVTSVVTKPNSNPCRRCLKDAQVGEEVTLLSYDAWLEDSPYRQAGPIFVHTKECELADLSGDTAVLPDQQAGRYLAVRAIDDKNMMVGFDTVQGEDLIERAEKFFKEVDAVKYLHVHYAAPGCFAVRIDRGVEQ